LLASLPPPVKTKNNFLRLRAKQCRDLRASLIDGIVGSFAIRVRAGGIAEVRLQVRQHHLNDGGIERRGGVVVEVDRGHFRGPIWFIGRDT